jgi:3D (Asp-Asp-Asp) domain-containing protein
MIVPIKGRVARAVAQSAVGAAMLALTAWSAIVVKEASVATPLVETVTAVSATHGPEVEVRASPVVMHQTSDMPEEGTVRWFDGRRVVPVRTIWMRVTAYSPDARSCGKWADGQTATLHSVWTNAMRLVAADPKVLPYGSLLSVPGYADGEVVPVLDCGGAIKGNRLDVLMPTHEIARRWGKRDIPVTVWAYEDELEN